MFTGKAELGQGIKTALLQIAAEELVVSVGRLKLVTADTALTPNEGYTAGSHSMQDSGTAIRYAAAQVREILIALAAAAAASAGRPAQASPRRRWWAGRAAPELRRAGAAGHRCTSRPSRRRC